MIGFAGLSHLGTVWVAGSASKGQEVVAYDPDASVSDALRVGRSPVLEPGLGELLLGNLRRVCATSDPSFLSEGGVVFVSRDVPTDADGRSDLAPIRELVDSVIPHLRAGTTVVVLSQVPPTFTRAFSVSLRAQDVTTFFQVETLIFGQAVERVLHPEFFAVGCAAPASELPVPYARFLESWNCPIHRMRYESAELAKIAINQYLAASIGVTNMLAELCETTGGEWSEIVPILREDRRIGPYAYLAPGLGIGGGNLQRDIATVLDLSKARGTDAGWLEGLLAQSRYRRDWVLRILHRAVLSRCERPRIALWGLAYKAHTQSTKNAPSFALLEALRGTEVAVYDPQVSLSADALSGAVQVPSALEACRDADALVVLTPWPEFASLLPEAVLARMRGRIILDPLSALNHEAYSDRGAEFYRLGSVSTRQEEIG